MLGPMHFRDRHHHLQYLKAELAAQRVAETPEVIAEARDFMERFWRPDPHSARALASWEGLLARPPSEIAARLLEDSAEGEWLRETCPPFGVITAQQAAVLLDRVRAGG